MQTLKLADISEANSELHKYENYVFFLPFNIATHYAACQLLGPHDTLQCVFLIMELHRDFLLQLLLLLGCINMHL